MNNKNLNIFFDKKLEEGAIFYTEKENCFNVFKLIRIDNELNTYHVKVYKEVLVLPTEENIKNLEVLAHHAPININGFEKPKLLSMSRINDNDLIGYLEYIKQTENINEIVEYAKKYYQEGYELSNQKKYNLAIKKYSITIELIPTFFEAIDNRAFCKMDMGLWQEAIKDFNESLKVNPDSFLAAFSIGECYFKLEKYQSAEKSFKKALQIEPENKFTKTYLRRTKEMTNL